MKKPFKFFLIVSVVAVLASLAGGKHHMRQAEIDGLRPLVPEGAVVRPIQKNLYNAADTDGNLYYIATGMYPSYGGPLKMAVRSDKKGTLLSLGILSTTDTSSYIENVLKKGLLSGYPGKNISEPSDVDTISGATITSTAMLRATGAAEALISNAYFGTNLPVGGKTAITPGLPDFVMPLFFIAAFFVSLKSYPGNRKFVRPAMLLATIALTGFYFGRLLSLTTAAYAVSGLWLAGVASATALIALILAVAGIIITKKNLYCTYICPFGATQELLGMVMKNKPVPGMPVIKWFVRILMVVSLCIALLLNDPSIAGYEPFAFFFKFVGTPMMFVLSIITIVASLLFRRPWCNTLCPVGSLLGIIQEARTARGGI